MPEPKLLPSLGITFLLCYVALSRARGGGASRLSSHAHRSSSSRQKPRKRGGAEGGSEQQCQGFLDLIRNESQLRHEQRETKPSLTRKQLGEGRLVVVIIGPASTGVHQRYVVEKLLRYLRWSNLIRRHFLMTPDDLGSTARDGASSSAPRDNLTDISSSRNRENGRHTRWTGNVLDTGATPGGKNGSLANGNGHGSGGKNGDRQRGTPAAVRQTQGYTYSDRGKAAALETIAAQESAKKVAAWLNGLSAGGVAVVEARGSGWASTRHGREGLPGFLRQTAGPDVGVLWVEVLPSGLYHHGSSSCSNGGSSTGADDPLRSPTLLPYSSPLFTRTGGSGHPQTAAAHRSSGGTATGAAETTENGVGGAWKSVNGLPRGVPKGLGGNVVDTFLQSGSL